MKRLVALTAVSIALLACGKDDRAAGPTPGSSPADRPTTSTSPSPAVSTAPGSDQPTDAAGQAAGSAGSARTGAPPAGSRQREGGASASADVHVVARGDTLYEIAKARRVSVQDLAKWNGIDDPRRLRIGQKIRLAAP